MGYLRPHFTRTCARDKGPDAERGHSTSRMKTLHAERLTLVPVDARNARELWRVLNAPDLRKYQDIPRIPAEDFERQVRSRPRALDGRSTGSSGSCKRSRNPSARSAGSRCASTTARRTSARSATVWSKKHAAAAT